MKITDVKLVLDKEFYYAGDNVTGKLVVTTHDPSWATQGKAFLKLYDKLDVQWLEDEMISIGITKRSYSNQRRPFQVNFETFFDKHDAEHTESGHETIYTYAFDFCLPVKVQGTLDVPNAKCQYFLKAFLSNDESVFKHYSNGTNTFDEFFKSLNHTYTKKEVIVHNKPAPMAPAIKERPYLIEAKSSQIAVTVTLPKKAFARGETIEARVVVKNIDESEKHLDLHKVGFKIFQLVKLLASAPVVKTRLFEHMVTHSSRKRLTKNTEDSIIIDELVQVPTNIPPTSSRYISHSSEDDTKKVLVNPIRINYKLSIEFWTNFFNDELEVNIPILIDPEM